MTDKLIAVDWGSTNLRVYLLDQSGKILAKKFARRGILHIRQKRFIEALKQSLGEWLPQNRRAAIVMSGMIGSRQGLVEVDYLPCPCEIAALGLHLRKIDALNRHLHIVPGLAVRTDTSYDVMRGEETQIAGCLLENKLSEGLLCLPGTHSKWAWVKDHRVLDFASYMTGELFTLLAKHSILAKLLSRRYFDKAAFARGVELAQVSEAWLNLIFQARTQVLSGQLAENQVHSFLSGLLIGYEIKQGLARFEQARQLPVNIIANPRIAEIYSHAFAIHNIHAHIKDVDQVTTQGLHYFAKTKGLIK